jgi:hypothetical protein
MLTKMCKTCAEVKPLSEYNKAPGYVMGVKPQCKPCYSAYNKAWKNANETKESRRYAWVKHKYGLTKEAYDAMLTKAGGKCEACGCNNQEPHVDHCHTTGTVRGLLCDLCNRGIGLFMDSPDKLRSAANYLNAFKEHTRWTHH